MNALTILLPEVSPSSKTMPPRIPRAAHRHAAPSGPWPWADLVENDKPFMLPNIDEPEDEFMNSDPVHSSSNLWRKYPGLFFPNWTRSRLERSGIAKVIKGQLQQGQASRSAVVYHIDVGQDGHFSPPGEIVVKQNHESRDAFWDMLKVSESAHSVTRVLKRLCPAARST